MPEPISLISNSEIKPEEFLDFLNSSGVILNPDHIYDGRISQGDRHIWIALDNSELKNFEVEEIELITQKLAGRPKTHILLDISQTPGSKQLAIDFASKFAERWNCIMYESGNCLYSPLELLELH